METSRIYESKWLSAIDLKGQSHELIIDSASIVQFDDPDRPGMKKDKIALAFRLPSGEKTRKQMTLNASQYKVIVRLARGETDTDAWLNMPIILSPTPLAGGKETISVYGATTASTESAPSF